MSQANVREERRARGITQFELAVLTGIDQGAISRIENGRTPNLKQAVALERALGIPVQAWVEQPAPEPVAAGAEG